MTLSGCLIRIKVKRTAQTRLLSCYDSSEVNGTILESGAVGLGAMMLYAVNQNF